ncbi:MAG: hypothetical protein JWQ97_2691 [Phenylobacterium sp.]|nr:hypothetical protein [Phenylobacterium sp.]
MMVADPADPLTVAARALLAARLAHIAALAARALSLVVSPALHRLRWTMVLLRRPALTLSVPGLDPVSGLAGGTSPLIVGLWLSGGWRRSRHHGRTQRDEDQRLHAMTFHSPPRRSGNAAAGIRMRRPNQGALVITRPGGDKADQRSREGSPCLSR